MLLIALPSPLLAQAEECRVPDALPVPQPEGPTMKEPRRIMPVTGYTLALTWQPEYCRFRGDDPKEALQCGKDAARRSFTLHGLWPDGADGWPQYCAPAAILPKPVVQSNFCATPSVQLLQHEWAKHGTCVQTDPARFFRAATRMYRAVRYPKMRLLSFERPSVGKLAEAFVAANPGLSTDMIKVQTDRKGWLTEVWLCLARDLRPTRCRVPMTDKERGRTLSIWRGR